MPLSWNEIKARATAFSNEWKNESSEDAEAKSFWDEFFYIFDIRRRRLASFEYHVKQLNNAHGYIDLFWPGTLIVEHKSRSRSLDKAHTQVMDYFHGIPDKELPKYILVSDFARFRLYDLDNDSIHEFKLEELTDNISLFGFIAGYQKRTYKEQDPVNIEAAELMGRLHDKLKAVGYEGHALELYLVRLVFLLFADDTNIFNERGLLFDYLDLQTREDGSDLAATLAQLFEMLNTPTEKRLRNVEETLAAFPYVNGKLFEERLPMAAFDSGMRTILLDCCKLDWGKISPAIFGSLFQSVMDAKARRNLGAHYTSEKNILKLIKPLFLDDLYAEFGSAKDSKAKLKSFHEKLAGLRFLDPACGCGNFLIIAYREIRLLEIDVIKQRLKLQGFREEVLRDARVGIDQLVQCDVDRFYGIEYEEFPAQIAQVAMWLIDHQMNQLVSNTFGEYYVRLPLKKSATIRHGNALRMDWQNLIEPMPWEGAARFDYIMGNPPFIGKTWQNDEQREDMKNVFVELRISADLDYVCAWYKIACDYLMVNSQARIAFVSTNSITQGEQVSALWEYLITKFTIEIFFAHRTFKWNNEAKGNANVHVVIIGLSRVSNNPKYLYDYEKNNAEPHVIQAKNINPYLLPASNTFIKKQQRPLAAIPEMRCGNKPSDGGHLILTSEDVEQLLNTDDIGKNFVFPFFGSDEFINNKKRFCLWLRDANPSEYRKSKFILKRLEAVKSFREASTAVPTRKAAAFPYLFFYISQPRSNFIVVPEVSSERRKYIPIAIVEPNQIASNKIFLIESENMYLLGVISSLMHMTWVRTVAGRMKSDYSYSGSIVYNTFPWPENPTDKQKQNVEACAQAVLDARALFPDASLADLYDPNTMPPALVKAHQALDKAVDLCYRPQAFPNETKRIEYLFELYDKYTSGMFGKEKKKK